MIKKVFCELKRAKFSDILLGLKWLECQYQETENTKGCRRGQII